MIPSFILGGIIGLLAGLLWCYWKQINAVYENRDLISKGGTAVSSVQDFIGAVRDKF